MNKNDILHIIFKLNIDSQHVQLLIQLLVESMDETTNNNVIWFVNNGLINKLKDMFNYGLQNTIRTIEILLPALNITYELLFQCVSVFKKAKIVSIY